MHEVIDLVAIFDFVVKLAAGIVTLSAAAAIIMPKSRQWIIKKLTASEAAEKEKAEKEEAERRIAEVEGKVESVEKTVGVILHDRYFQACLYNLERGYTTSVDLENINYLWESYNACGHNGYGLALYEKVCKLDVHPNKYL